MLGSLASRQRRPLWGTLSCIFAIGIGVAVWTAGNARGEATRQAALDATSTARTELAPLLQPKDLMGPIIGERAVSLTDDIERAITSVSPVSEVRIYSSLGRILFAKDPSIVGTRPSYLRALTFEVANGDGQSRVRAGELETFVPIWLNPDGAVVVAELSQPFQPIAAGATGSMNLIALALGALFLVSVTMTLLASRSPAPAAVPIQEHPGFELIEERRAEAERRAAKSEEDLRAVRQQLKDSLAQIRALDATISTSETQTSRTGEDLKVLREQLTETAERAHKLELENRTLRERMALRNQELDEVRRELSRARAEMERLGNELDETKSRLHMSKLSEALREFDNDEIRIGNDDEDDLYEHPVIIRRSTLATNGKVG